MNRLEIRLTVYKQRHCLLTEARIRIWCCTLDNLIVMAIVPPQLVARNTPQLALQILICTYI